MINIFRVKHIRIIVMITAFFCLEEFLLKWISDNSAIWLLCRMSVEFVIYGIFVLKLIKIIIDGRRIPKSPIDSYLLIFILLFIMSFLINKSDIIPSLSYFRVIFRYLFVFYLVFYSQIDEKSVQLSLNTILLFGISEAILGIALFFSPESIKNIFILKGPSIEATLATITDQVDLKLGAVAGTFGRPGAMAFFLLIAFIISVIKLIFYNYKKYQLLYPIIILLGIFVTYKRGPFILALCSIPLCLWFSNKKRTCWKLVTFGVVVSIFCLTFLIGKSRGFDYRNPREEQVSTYEYVGQFASSEYWDNFFQSSRGWFLREVGFSLFHGINLIGYGPDKDHAKELLAGNDKNLRLITKYGAFDDVYWVAFSVYFGLIGSFLLFFILLKIHSTSKLLIKIGDSKDRSLGIILCVLILLLIPSMFLERVLELHAFSFTFWLMSGLVCARFRLISGDRHVYYKI